MKVAGYFRESSADTTKAPPITEQIDRFDQWVKENNHQVMFKFIDNGYSGGDWNRPEWLKSINEAKRHSYQMLWVWNQDRIARDTEQFLYYYRNLKNSHTQIYEDTSSCIIDMENLGNRVKHQSLAQASEIFRLVTSEKVKRAYQRKKQAGGNWGRPKLKIPTELIFELRSQGKGYRQIAKEIGGLSYQTVKRTLQNRVI